MELKLVVMTPAKWKGKVIPVSCSPFLIGRDPECHLRATSRVISQRQCALLTREDKAFVQDLNTTNGTFVNNRQIKGEIELLNGDRLEVKPLTFVVHLTSGVGVDQATPIPPSKLAVKPTSDEVAAALLLSLQDEPPAKPVSSADEVPTSQTTMREVKTSLLAMDPPAAPPPAEPFGSVSSAREILKKYKKPKKK
jgi:pSer/pThr/pTyr-binding forkhead associated (FHA) protein